MYHPKSPAWPGWKGQSLRGFGGQLVMKMQGLDSNQSFCILGNNKIRTLQLV